MPVVMKASMKAGIQLLDRKVIKTRWSRINRDPMQRAGNKVRMIARGSIRRRSSSKPKAKRKPSPAGEPPRSWTQGKTPPFKMIFNLPHGRMGVGQIIGMVGFGGTGMPVPGIQEHGGLVRRRVFVKGPQRRTKKGQFGRRKNIPVTKTVRYPKRPFMEPALMKAKSQLPRFWEGSVNKAA